jgi:hypothetical protein
MHHGEKQTAISLATFFVTNLHGQSKIFDVFGKEQIFFTDTGCTIHPFFS